MTEKYKIVQFDNGKYGVRKKGWFVNYYLSIGGNWWPSFATANVRDFSTYSTIEEAKIYLNKYLTNKTIVKEVKEIE